MENFEKLRAASKVDTRPSEKYYTLEEQLKGLSVGKPSRKALALPRKKRSPVIKNDPNESDDDDNDEDNTPEEVPEEKKEERKKKSYALSYNRQAKIVIDFILNRFIWEIYSIEPDESDDSPETKDDIAEYILENITTAFASTCNITQLIINSVKSYNPGTIITNSHGLDKEIRPNICKIFNNANFGNVVTDYLIDFLKLLMLFFSNHFWLEKTCTISLNSFATVLRHIELIIPADCSTISKGLLDDIITYETLISASRPNKKPAESKAESKTDGKSKDKSKNKADYKPKTRTRSKKTDPDPESEPEPEQESDPESDNPPDEDKAPEDPQPKKVKIHD